MYRLTADQDAFVRTATEVADRSIAPHAERVDADGVFPQEGLLGLTIAPEWVSKHLGLERNFRDARAATVMAPTTDQAYDFIGRALCGMELF